MSKKIVFYSAITLFGLGISCLLVSFLFDYATMGLSIAIKNKLYAIELHEKEAHHNTYSLENIKNIIVEVDISSVEIQNGRNGVIEVYTENSVNSSFVQTVQRNDTLHITQRLNEKIYNFRGEPLKKLIVVIPRDFHFNNVSISLNVGAVYANNSQVLTNKLTLKNYMGIFEMNNVLANGLLLQNNIGSVKLDGDFSGHIIVNNTIGSSKLTTESNSEQWTYMVNSTLSNTKIADPFKMTFNLESLINSLQQENHIDIDNTLGTVTLTVN